MSTPETQPLVRKTAVSAPQPTPPQQSAPSTAQQVKVTTNNASYRLPSDLTLQNAAKLSIVEDKPVMFDYWTDSLDKKIIIGVRQENGEKMLVKSSEEYTSPISKFYKSLSEYIVITENSIYIVSSDIVTKKIS
jgi:hypothetical protein